MPLLSQVHAAGQDDGPSNALPPVQQTVSVPVPTPGTDAGSQPALFGDEAYFYARCSASDAIGACVCANSTLASVKTADASQANPVVGIIVAKGNDTNCTVQRYGESSIRFANLITGKRYFLGTSGGLVTPPFPAKAIEYVQQVGNAISSTKLFIQPTGTAIKRDIDDNEDDMATCSCFIPGYGVPDASVGKLQDVFYDKATQTIYGPKTAAGWGDGSTLQGPPGRVGVAGAKGDRGDAGPTGPAGAPGMGQTGAQGPTGPAGPQGSVGEAGPRGEQGPAGADGIGSQGPVGAKGDTGDVGPRGPMGFAGEAGATIINDSGPPSDDVGAVGDLYYDEANHVFYGAKTDNGWGTGFSLQGPKGDRGEAGPAGSDGRDGTRWIEGDGPPAADNTYPQGTYYYDYTNKQIYPPDQGAQ